MKKRILTLILVVAAAFALSVTVFAADADSVDSALKELFGETFPLIVVFRLLFTLMTPIFGAVTAFVYLYLQEKKKLDANRRFFGPLPPEMPASPAPVPPGAYYGGEVTQSTRGGTQP